MYFLFNLDRTIIFIWLCELNALYISKFQRFRYKYMLINQKKNKKRRSTIRRLDILTSINFGTLIWCHALGIDIIRIVVLIAKQEAIIQ